MATSGEMGEKALTDRTATQFIMDVSHQSHAMAGAVIALSAAQAAALGQACMRISRDDLELGDPAIDEQISRLSEAIEKLLIWCDRDAVAIAEFVALRDAEQKLKGQELLCHAPAEISQISIETAKTLQAFRSHVCERVRDDLEMSITLLAGAAQATALLLDSNLRIWPETALLTQFEPVLERLLLDISDLTPPVRIRA